MSHLLSCFPQDKLFIVVSELLQIIESDGGHLAWLDLSAHGAQHVPFGETVASLVKRALSDRVEPCS